MIAENTRDIENGIIDIFALFDGTKIIGELRVKYISDDNTGLLKKANEHTSMLSVFIRNIKARD